MGEQAREQAQQGPSLSIVTHSSDKAVALWIVGEEVGTETASAWIKGSEAWWDETVQEPEGKCLHG